MMGTFENRGGRPKKGNSVEAQPHFLQDKLIAALFVHHRELMPRELERRLLPLVVPQPMEEVTIIRNVFKVKPPKTVICLPDQSDTLPIQRPARRKVAIIVEEVCRKHSITLALFMGGSKTRHLAAARREACYRIARETDMSIPAIGRFIKKDHSTVMHAISRYCEINGIEQPREKQGRFRASTPRGATVQTSLAD
jgi:hypothetical protein